MQKRPDIKLELDQTITTNFAGAAKVVGVDLYYFVGGDGRNHHWESYTLTSPQAAPYDRFWIANVPEQGGFLFRDARNTPRPADAEFKENLSGLARLDSIGDASLSSAFSSLAVWQTPQGVIHSLEVFGDGAPLRFIGTPFDLKI